MQKKACGRSTLPVTRIAALSDVGAATLWSTCWPHLGSIYSSSVFWTTSSSAAAHRWSCSCSIRTAHTAEGCGLHLLSHADSQAFVCTAVNQYGWGLVTLNRHVLTMRNILSEAIFTPKKPKNGVHRKCHHHTLPTDTTQPAPNTNPNPNPDPNPDEGRFPARCFIDQKGVTVFSAAVFWFFSSRERGGCGGIIYFHVEKRTEHGSHLRSALPHTSANTKQATLKA